MLQIKKFYQTYPNTNALRSQLSWTHYQTLNKIEILKQVHHGDDMGFTNTTLEPIAPPLWAYFRQLSGEEVFAAATTNYKEEVLTARI